MRAGCSMRWRTWSRAPARRPEIDGVHRPTALGEQLRRYDKGGDQFYDTISALHKRCAAATPTPSLYWFVRMLDGGVDRATSRAARAHGQRGHRPGRPARESLDAAETYERLGSPEGDSALAQAVIYLRRAPKSNAVYAGYGARAFVAADQHAAGAAASTQRADPADEGPGPRQGLPLRARRSRRLRGRGALFPEGARARFYEPAERGLEIRIGERWPSCALNDEATKAGRVRTSAVAAVLEPAALTLVARRIRPAASPAEQASPDCGGLSATRVRRRVSAAS